MAGTVEDYTKVQNTLGDGGKDVLYQHHQLSVDLEEADKLSLEDPDSPRLEAWKENYLAMNVDKYQFQYLAISLFFMQGFGDLE